MALFADSPVIQSLISQLRKALASASLSTVKDSADITQKIVTVVAVLVAAGWFVFRGEHNPRLEISHDFENVCLEGTKHRMIRVAITARNIGVVPIALSKYEHSLRRVVPVEQRIVTAINEVKPYSNEPVIPWPTIDKRESEKKSHEFIEPGETHTQYHDFVVQSSDKTFEVVTYYENPERRSSDRTSSSFGWTKRSLYNLGENKCTGEN